MTIRETVEDLVYKKIIRTVVLTSKLGRQSVLGEASTGYNFDHMYENKADGLYLIGRIVDRILLSLPAVQATRNRRTNIVKILANEIQNHKVEGKKTRVIDIACGTGRYLTDILASFQDGNTEVVGVDYDRRSLALGEKLAKNYGVSESNIRFVRGNVFRLKLLKRFGTSIHWKPNIIVSSGLTVYIDDDKVIDMLQQVYDGLDQNGLFIFDSQESNPSRKLMEKVCNTRDGSWILYYRPPALWRKWLKEVGFKDIIVSCDQWHMYNLCTARKSS